MILTGISGWVFLLNFVHRKRPICILGTLTKLPAFLDSFYCLNYCHGSIIGILDKNNVALVSKILNEMRKSILLKIMIDNG